MSRGGITLSPVAAAYLRDRLDHDLHPMLRVGWLPVGATEQDRAQAFEAGRRELQEQGLLQFDDLDPFLDDAVNLLARPPVAVGLAVQLRDGENYNAVHVEHGRATVRAVQPDGQHPEELREILLSRHEYGGPVGNAVAMLGQLKPGPGNSVSVPYEQVRKAAHKAATSGPQSGFRSAGLRAEDAQALATAFSARRTAEGVLTVRAYDAKIRRTHTLPYNLQFFVTDDGCYMMRKKPGPDGREWFTLAPAEARKLTATGEEMVRELRSAALV